MTTKEEVIVAKNNVDRDITIFIDRLKIYKPIHEMNLSNIFEFLTHKEINEIFRKDDDIRSLFEKAMKSQEEFINIMDKWHYNNKEVK